MKGPDLRFTLADPKIFDVSCMRRPSDDPYHDAWHATYEELPTIRTRLVVVTFHAGDESAELTITAGALFIASSRSAIEARGDDLRAILARSLALETFYDIIRMHARTLMGMLMIDLELPEKSPDAELVIFTERRPEGDTTDEDDTTDGDEPQKRAESQHEIVP